MPFIIRKSSSAANSAARPSAARKGIALVEVIVAMVLLAVAVTSLAALVGSVSKSGIKTAGNAYRNGVLMQEVNRLEGIPYDSIPVGSTSFSVSTGTYPHTRVVTVAEPAVQRVKTVQIVITPVNSNYKPDTVAFTRTKAKTSKVLCTTCQ